MSRVIYRAVLSALVILACAVSACADVSLFRGAENIGSVQTIEKDSEIFVPVDDVAKLFGFKSSRSGEELVLTQGNSRIRVIENSAAAWRGLSIVPLYSAPFERNGKMWVDTQSAASLFQAFAGRGESNRLRFLSNTETLAGQVTPARKTDTPRPAPVTVVAARPVNTPAPAAPEPEPQKTPETPETPALSVTASNTPEPAIAELPLSDDTERRLAARISSRREFPVEQGLRRSPKTRKSLRVRRSLKTQSRALRSSQESRHSGPAISAQRKVNPMAGLSRKSGGITLTVHTLR